MAEARRLTRERAVEEHNRLLYVAMTRAEERLYIAGFCGEKGPGEGCWYSMIEAAGLPLEEVPAPWDAAPGEPAETVSRMQDPAPEDDAAPKAPPPEAVSPSVTLPEWLLRPPRDDEVPDLPPIRPSNPLGAADQAGPPAWPYVDRSRDAGRRQAVAAGRLMHRLLQYLPDVPSDRRQATAARFLAAQGSALDEDHRTELAEQALAVLDDPSLAGLFGPGSRAEVAVTASVALPSGRRVDVTGQIDRIGVTDDAVHIVDFKTGTPGVVTPKQVLQLALYRAAVEPLYPDLDRPNASRLDGQRRGGGGVGGGLHGRTGDDGVGDGWRDVAERHRSIHHCGTNRLKAACAVDRSSHNRRGAGRKESACRRAPLDCRPARVGGEPRRSRSQW